MKPIILSKEDKLKIYKKSLAQLKKRREEGQAFYICNCISQQLYLDFSFGITEEEYLSMEFRSGVITKFFPELMKYKPVGKLISHGWFDDGYITREKVLNELIDHFENGHNTPV
jgi:hypothetical protein